MLLLKTKNAELEELSTALAQNLVRKQNSLEEALNAIHCLNEKKRESEANHKHSVDDSKSLTDTDILSLNHSNVFESDDDNNDENIMIFHPQSGSSDSYSSSTNNDTNEKQLKSSRFSSKGMKLRIKSMSRSWSRGKPTK